MRRKYIGLLATALMTSACGGGDSSTFGGTEPVSDSFGIDSGNGVAAARQSYEAVLASGGIADIGGAAGLSSAPSDGSAIARQAAAPEELVLDVVSLIPFGPDVEPCFGGTGTVTISGDIAVPGTLTPGDVFRIEYDLCDEGQGEIIDGDIDLTVRDFSGDLFLGTYLLGMDAVIDTLSIATGTDTLITDGDATIAINTQEAPYIETSVSGSRITQTSNAGTETLASYSSSQSLDGNQDPPEYTMDASGTLDSARLPGTVTYSTETTFRGFVPAYPREGALLVRGDSSSARLVVLDDTNVRVEIDSNGDGAVDDAIDLTWEEFLNPGP
jgi:hypothetical protein